MGQSLISLIRRIFWILLGIFLIFFAVSNRTRVTLSFEPFGTAGNIPVFLVLFAGIFIGLILAAGVTGWLRLKGFTRRRQAERRASSLEQQVSTLSEDVHKAHAAEAHEAARDGASGTQSLPKAGKDG
jgi:uncharacterized integral membrane protein